MNGLNGLDGRSVLIGGGLVLAGLFAARAGGLFPLLVIGGIVYFIGSKKGWWGDHGRHAGAGHELVKRGPGGPPGFFADWHRQAHANEAGGPAAHAAPPAWRPAPQPPQPPTWQQAQPQQHPGAPQPPYQQQYAPAGYAAPTPAQPPTPPAAAPAAQQDSEVRIPVSGAAPAAQDAQAPAGPETEYRRTVGEQDGPVSMA